VRGCGSAYCQCYCCLVVVVVVVVLLVSLDPKNLLLEHNRTCVSLGCRRFVCLAAQGLKHRLYFGRESVHTR